MSKQYFRLNPECYLTLGARGALIQNLYTKEAIWLSPEDAEAMAAAETSRQVTADEQPFADLAEEGWGFFTEQRVFIDKIRPFNVFRETRSWKSTPHASLAVLQLIGSCNLSCSWCATEFCPICLTDTDDRGPSLTTEQWKAVLDELRTFGVKNVVLTGGEVTLYDDLSAVVDHACSLGILPQIHTNGTRPIPAGIDRNVPVSAALMGGASPQQVVENLRGFVNVTLFHYETEAPRLDAPAGWNIAKMAHGGTRITKDRLVGADLDRFFVRRNADECLNGKLYVRHDGSVYPCFGYRGDPIGTVLDGGLSLSIKRLVNDYWETPLDKARPEQKCTACEFKYACTACRYLDAATQCAYEPTECVWT